MSKAIGIDKIEYGTVGDGVPATSFTEITDPIAEGSVVFNFSEPTDTKINSETSDTPVHVITTKDDVDYIEFALLTPEAATIGALGGGTVTSDKWEEATTIPEVTKTIKITTSTVDAEYIEHTIVNAKVICRWGQSPGKKQMETLIVRCYKQAAVTALGVTNTPYIREIKAVV